MTTLFTRDFTAQANTSVGSGANSVGSSSLGGGVGLTDRVGNIWNISSGRLVCFSSSYRADSIYYNGANGAFADGKVRNTFEGNGSGDFLWASGRIDPSTDDAYIAFLASNSFTIIKVIAGVQTTVSGSVSGALVITADTIVELEIIGSTLTARAYDSAAPTVAVLTYTGTDTSIPGPGRWGISAGFQSRFAKSIIISDNSSGGATAVTLTGPTSGTVGSSSTNFSVGVDTTPITGTVVVTPSDSSGGGTFTPTTVSLTTASPSATFTYTPGSTGTKTISVTNNGSLTNPSSITYTSNAISPVVTLTPYLSSRTDTSVELVYLGSPSGGSGSGYITRAYINLTGSFTPGTGNEIPVSSSADVGGNRLYFSKGSLSPSTTYYTKCVTTDGLGNSTTSTEISFTTFATVATRAIAIGDSITNGYNLEAAFRARYAAVGLTAAMHNVGQDGAQTSDWQKGGSNNYYKRAANLLTASGIRTVSIMLGTNDASQGVVKATYKSNLSSIISNLLADFSGLVIYLNASPYFKSGGTLNSAIITRLQECIEAQNELANGTTIKKGDRKLLEHGRQLDAAGTFYPTTYSDGVHPSLSAEQTYIGSGWADGILIGSIDVTATSILVAVNGTQLLVATPKNLSNAVITPAPDIIYRVLTGASTISSSGLFTGANAAEAPIVQIIAGSVVITVPTSVGGALSAGAISIVSSVGTSISLNSSVAIGGNSPYTYQWYRSTTRDFTPSAGNILAGKTQLNLTDSGLAPNTTYFYKIVATDIASALSISNQFLVNTGQAGITVNGLQGLGMPSIPGNLITAGGFTAEQLNRQTVSGTLATLLASGSYTPQQLMALGVPSSLAKYICGVV